MKYQLTTEELAQAVLDWLYIHSGLRAKGPWAVTIDFNPMTKKVTATAEKLHDATRPQEG